MITCARCGQLAEPDERNRHLCTACVKLENSRYTRLRQHQGDWLAEAKEIGVDAWLQQPNETQWEYTIWVTYRDMYPGKKPTYSAVAQQLGTTYNVVAKVAQRWTFPVRMQQWIAECDRITMAQRRDEILSMNAEHVCLAQKLRDKLDMAIECLNPETIKPSEIASLAKLATDLERKARVDTAAQEDLRKLLVADNQDLKKAQIGVGDMGEVVSILLKAGALGDIARIGVRQTTEVIVDDGGNYEDS